MSSQPQNNKVAASVFLPVALMTLDNTDVQNKAVVYIVACDLRLVLSAGVQHKLNYSLIADFVQLYERPAVAGVIMKLIQQRCNNNISVDVSDGITSVTSMTQNLDVTLYKSRKGSMKPSCVYTYVYVQPVLFKRNQIFN